MRSVVSDGGSEQAPWATFPRSAAVSVAGADWTPVGWAVETNTSISNGHAKEELVMKVPICSAAACPARRPTFADPWKDESGKGRWGYGYYRSYHYDRDYKQAAKHA